MEKDIENINLKRIRKYKRTAKVNAVGKSLMTVLPRTWLRAMDWNTTKKLVVTQFIDYQNKQIIIREATEDEKEIFNIDTETNPRDSPYRDREVDGNEGIQ